MFGKIKLRQTDIKYSKIIRAERTICERCKMKSSKCIHHYQRRGKENTRFDDKNIVALCVGCHDYFHKNPTEERDFMIKKLGEKEHDALILRSNMYKKRDDKLDKMWLDSR